MALHGTGERVHCDTLQKLALALCSREEYSIVELEAEFGEPIAGLFIGSLLEAAMKVCCVCWC